MSMVEQILDLISILIDKTKSDKLDWINVRDVEISVYDCKINETTSIRIKSFLSGEIMIKIGGMCFFTSDIPIIKDSLLRLTSEIFTKEHYKKEFEERLLELANITLEIEKI